VWVGRALAGVDIRAYGDGNPGAANAWRAGGWRSGVPALALDYLKGALPVAAAHHLCGVSGWGLVPVALAPILGHAFSPFLRFKGGKAIAVSFGIWSGLTLWRAPLVLGAVLTIAVALKEKGPCALVAGLAALLAYLVLAGYPPAIVAVWAGNAAVLVLKHRQELMAPCKAVVFAAHLLGRAR
jgi:glycerol-3-phosphate acyltransferase PlsY